MYWNHRVVRHVVEKLGETYYQIHEVYYDDDGKVTSMTENAVAPFGETTDELEWELNRMLDALKKPVLDYGVTDGKLEQWDESNLTDDERAFVEEHERMQKLMWPHLKRD